MKPKCEACQEPADAVVFLRVIPTDGNIPAMDEIFTLCWDHIEDPGPLYAMQRPTTAPPRKQDDEE